ncbi:MAG TPA: c-type cytochrome [Burkholderiaceae bacterium]|nr:c-type cytochrome [Burkholderiaceae bacterium]
MKIARCLRVTVCLAVLVHLSAPLVGNAQMKPAPTVDPARGQQIASQVCAACHGADGNSSATANPLLAQQHSAYLYKQLLDYSVRQGQQRPVRENAIMNGIASQLSDDDKRNASAWFASQTAQLNTARNKQTLELGQRIWRAGLPEKSLPACSGCHNPAGLGIPTQYPRLAAQHAEYVEATLKDFRQGTRRNNPAMQEIAAKLSDNEIRAVADFVQGLRLNDAAK